MKDEQIQSLKNHKDHCEILQEMTNDLLTEKKEMADEIEELRMQTPALKLA